MRRLLRALARRTPVLGSILRDRDRLYAELARLGAESDRRELLRGRAHEQWVRLLLASAASEPWYRDLVAVQDEIAGDTGTKGWYARAYRQEELLYWWHVPRWLREDAARAPIRRVLDVGAAYGTLALYARRTLGAEVFLTDFNDTYLSPALAARHGLTFARCNVELEPLPWPELRFDAILLTEVFEHFNFHPATTMAKLARALAPGGRIYLTTPDGGEWGRVTEFYDSVAAMPPPAAGRPVFDGHVYQYLEGELREVLEQGELRIERFDYAPGVIGRHFNLTLVAREQAAKAARVG